MLRQQSWLSSVPEQSIPAQQAMACASSAMGFKHPANAPPSSTARLKSAPARIITQQFSAEWLNRSMPF
jgi:hypothetical protein